MLSDLILYQKTYDFLVWMRHSIERFPRMHKYTLGLQIQNEILELLKFMAIANAKKDKRTDIEICAGHYEAVRIFIRLANEYKVLNVKQYEFASRQMEEIGRLLYGWLNKN